MKIFTKKRLVLALGLLLAGAAVAVWLHSKKEKPLPDSKYRSVAADTGNITIMLVSVTERTREIGIRMAIGAKPRDVLLQVLTEAVVICLAGGVIGIAIAAGCAAAITATGKFDVFITAEAIAVACGFSSLVGVFFGFYPARRASRLLPVDCLRYE